MQLVAQTTNASAAGLIMNVTSCWTNHGSIVEFRGHWYLFYHTDALSGGLDHRRSLAVEALTFEADGSIRVRCHHMHA